MPSYRIPMVRKDGRGAKITWLVDDVANEAEAMDLAEERANSPDVPEENRYVALTWEELPDAR